MKTLPVKLGSLLAALLCCLPAVAQILPTPLADRPSQGIFMLTEHTLISYDSELEPLADYLGDYLPASPRSDRYATFNSIALRLDPSQEGEAYMLRIRPDFVEIAGGDYGGVFNGIQSLLQLLPPSVCDGTMPLPQALACRTVEDAPRFAYRGQMLDVARTWIGPDRIKRYIDLLSHHKINKLHLHLADDEGWRIEIRSHPELTEIGGFRGGDSPVRPVYGKWDERYGGYFTQEEMRDLIRFAAIRNVEIIPEIDLPGHSRNIARVHPEILCAYPPDTAASNGYDLRSAWCVAREENYTLLGDILTELSDLFPSPVIHIGGDEVERSQWERCPHCRELMRREGMTSTAQLQSYFMSRLVTMLASERKRPGVWNEAIDGGMTREALVYGWESVAAARKAAAAGYRTVVMPAQYFYFDMRQSPQEEGHDWAAVVTPERVASFDLEEQGFTAAEIRHVAGFEATFWSEAYVSHEPEKPDYLDYMLFPRVAILSELAWCGSSGDWPSLRKRIGGAYADRLSALGVRYRLFPPEVTYREGILTARPDAAGGKLFYAVDPSDSLRPYEGAIRTTHPERYRFRTLRGTGRSPWAAVAAYYRTIRPAVSLTSSIPESKRAPFKRVEEYRSFAWTRRACRRGDWLLFRFAQPVTCRELTLQTGNRQLPKCIFTTGDVEVSYDGQTFERAGELDKGAFTLRPSRPVRAVRIVSTCDDNGCAFVTIQPLKIRP